MVSKLFSKIARSGLATFTRELIYNPSQVGAALPSSLFLARAMAAEIPLERNGLVIELGAGTGVVTQAIVERGVPQEQLVVIEYSPSLVEHLRQRFPQLTIIQGDAAKLAELIQDKALPVKAIISSLPLRSLAREKVEQISAQIDQLLQPEDVFIQFTYSWKRDHGHYSQRLKLSHSIRIWRNIPPARIDVFRIQ